MRPPRTTHVRRTLRSALLLGMVLMSVWASPASAFDDSRSGFVLELGLGPGVCPSSSWLYSYETGDQVAYREEDTRFALHTRFRIGGGLSKQWMVAYVYDVAWSNDALTGPGDWNLTANALSGIALTRFLQPEAPSWLIEAAAGFASVEQLEENPFDETGPGMQLTVGVETATHWTLRLSWAHAWYDELQDRSSVGVTFSRLWY